MYDKVIEITPNKFDPREREKGGLYISSICSSLRRKGFKCLKTIQYVEHFASLVVLEGSLQSMIIIQPYCGRLLSCVKLRTEKTSPRGHL